MNYSFIIKALLDIIVELETKIKELHDAIIDKDREYSDILNSIEIERNKRNKK